MTLMAWNDTSSEDVQEICANDLLSEDQNDERKAKMKGSLSQRWVTLLLSLLCLADNTAAKTSEVSLSASETIFQRLLTTLPQWGICASRPLPSHVVNLLTLLSLRFNHVADVGRVMIRLLSQCGDGGSTTAILFTLELFTRMLQHVHHELNPSLSSIAEMKDNSLVPTRQRHKISPSPAPPRPSQSLVKRKTCSFVETGGDFAEQHWYNCYTCNLLWDKGCCSLCAQVCHAGHVLSYSRYSSFFL
jgi:hypothetical protein